MPVYSSKKVPVFMGFRYGREVLITNNSSNNYTDVQVEFLFDTASLITANKLKSDGSDFVVVDENLNFLPHWIQKETLNTANSRIWTKLPSISANSTIRIFVYYNDPEFPNIAKPDNVFLLFDDFNGPAGSIPDTSKWSLGGTPVLNGNSYVALADENYTTTDTITSLNTFGDDTILRVRAYFSTPSTSGEWERIGYSTQVYLADYVGWSGRSFFYNSTSYVAVNDFRGATNIFEIQRFGVQSKYFRNYILEANPTTGSTVGNLPISAGAYQAWPYAIDYVVLYIDWLFVAKNAYTNLSAVVGAEEPIIKRSFLIQPIF